MLDKDRPWNQEHNYLGDSGAWSQHAYKVAAQMKWDFDLIFVSSWIGNSRMWDNYSFGIGDADVTEYDTSAIFYDSGLCINIFLRRVKEVSLDFDSG